MIEVFLMSVKGCTCTVSVHLTSVSGPTAGPGKWIFFFTLNSDESCYANQKHKMWDDKKKSSDTPWAWHIQVFSVKFSSKTSGKQERKWVACCRPYEQDTRCCKCACSFMFFSPFKALHESYNLCFPGLCRFLSACSKHHVNEMCVFESESVFLSPSKWWATLGIRSPLCFSALNPISFPHEAINQVTDAYPQPNNETRFISPNCLVFVSNLNMCVLS